MTLVVGLKGAGGVVLASDSQATRGEIRETQAKLFKTKCGVVWGSSGPFAGTQDLYTALEGVDLPVNPGREEAKLAIRKAMLSAGWASVGDGHSQPAVSRDARSPNPPRDPLRRFGPNRARTYGRVARSRALITDS